ncbi:MAG: Cof-type HAD-IIB family hydrolase [Lachnospiraceae bacterium]|nr:Cof-type HAD-IIB family hydrolase [Lachnospiraceae bacterium]
MIKLVASDLDGTLLKEHTNALSANTISLIWRLLEHNIHFVVASGRQLFNEYRLFEMFGDKISYIAENGSICIHKGKILSRILINPDLASRIIKEMKRRDDFELMISFDHGCYVEGKNPDFIRLMEKGLCNKVYIVDDLSKIKGNIMKLATLYCGDNKKEKDSYHQHLNQLFQDELDIVTSGSWIDFITPGGNKGASLKKLIEAMHIKTEECMAFGDQCNDIEMLKLVGTDYAMSAGHPAVISLAGNIADSVDEVLEDLLNTYTQK